MKRTISLLLCLLTLLSLTACGGKYPKEQLQYTLDNTTVEDYNKAGSLENILKTYGYYQHNLKTVSPAGENEGTLVYTTDEKGNYVQYGYIGGDEAMESYTGDGANYCYYPTRNSGSLDVFPASKYNENFLVYYALTEISEEGLTKGTGKGQLVLTQLLDHGEEYEYYDQMFYYLNPETLLTEKTVMKTFDRNDLLMETTESTYVYGKPDKEQELPKVRNMADDPEALTLTVIDLDKNGNQLAERHYPVKKGLYVIAWDFTESYTPYRDAECTKQLFEYATINEDMTLYLKEN